MKRSGKVTLLALSIALLGSLAWAATGPANPETATGAPETPARLDANQVRSVTLEVDGVSCASCSLTIRKALKKVDGVKSIDEGKSKEFLIVKVDPAKVSDDTLVQAVKKAGFGAKVVAPKT